MQSCNQGPARRGLGVNLSALMGFKGFGYLFMHAFCEPWSKLLVRRSYSFLFGSLSRAARPGFV